MKIILTVIAMLFSMHTLACSCEGPPDFDKDFEEAEVVAFVKVCEAHLEERSYKASKLNNKTGEWANVVESEVVLAATGLVEEQFKGSPVNAIKIKGANPNSSCHVPIEVGKTYLAFVGPEGYAHIGVCSSTVQPRHLGMEYIRKLNPKGSNKLSKRDAVNCAPS